MGPLFPLPSYIPAISVGCVCVCAREPACARVHVHGVGKAAADIANRLIGFALSCLVCQKLSSG